MFETRKGPGEGRQGYVSWMKSKLDHLESEVGKLQRNRERLRSSVVEDHEALMSALDRKISKGREKVKEIVGSTDTSWHSIRDTADTILTDIKTNLDQARKNYHDELEDD